MMWNTKKKLRTHKRTGRKYLGAGKMRVLTIFIFIGLFPNNLKGLWKVLGGNGIPKKVVQVKTPGHFSRQKIIENKLPLIAAQYKFIRSNYMKTNIGRAKAKKLHFISE